MKFRVTETTTQVITNVYYVEASSAEEAEDIYESEGEYYDDESVVGDIIIDSVDVEEP